MNTAPLPLADPEDILISEMHHRFYNSMQVLASIAGRLARKESTIETQRLIAHEIQERIAALGHWHRLLATSPAGQFRDTCTELWNTLRVSFARPEAALTLEVDDVRLGTLAERTIMLLVAELMTNALKHAAPGEHLPVQVVVRTPEGAIEVQVVSPCPIGVAARTPSIALRLAAILGGTLEVTTKNGFDVRMHCPDGSATPAEKRQPCASGIATDRNRCESTRPGTR
jgi:two-component sensor histidine kinase